MPQAHPFYFGPRLRPLFGWLHQPEAACAQNVGLLICGPLGYDAISGHRTLRHLATESAACGFSALRFDYDGTGDSAGHDEDSARVDAWLESIRIAALTLRQHTGVRHIYLFGIRLGASLALMAAQDLPEVAGVLLVNPVVEGRRYLRELRALATTSAVAANNRATANQDVQEAAGFITTAETRQAIGAIGLAGDSLQRAPSRALLLQRTDLPVDSSLADRLRQLDCSVTLLPFAGYADMLRDAHETLVPRAMIQEALAWMQSVPHDSATVPTRQLTNSCEFSWTAGAESDLLRESAVRVGETGTIFGILTERRASADGAAPARPVLLLLNSGAVHHVGPNELYVRLARMMALRDFAVLRFDLPGLGDSPVKAGLKENQPYPDGAMVAIRQAVDYIRNRFPGSSISCAGICSGAYHSLKAAAANLPLRSIIVINPLTFFWKPGMSLAQPAYQDTAEIMRYRRTAFSSVSLRKLFFGRVKLLNLAGILQRYAMRRVLNAARGIGRRLGIPLKDDLVAELRAIRAHGTHLHFVFAATDPGHSMLQEQGGAEVRYLVRTGAVTIEFIDHSDHTFTPRTAQQNLLSLLEKFLVASHERSS